MSRFSVPGPDPATLLLEASANTPLFLRSDGHSGETPSTKSITRSRLACPCLSSPIPATQSLIIGRIESQRALVERTGNVCTCHLSGDYEPSTSDWARKQAELFERSGGTEANTVRGMPIILVTSVGAQSGKLRKTPLMRVEHNGEYAAVASLGGAPKHPVWYYNLKKHPHVELQDGAVKRDYLAREVTGEEKAVWWERPVAAYPDYADYQEKTTREIPVFVLTPMTKEEAAT